MVKFKVGDHVRRVAPVVGLSGVLQQGHVYQISVTCDSVNFHNKPEFRLLGIPGHTWAQNSDDTRWELVARPVKVNDEVFYLSPIIPEPQGKQGGNDPFKIRKIVDGKVYLENYPSDDYCWQEKYFIHADLWLEHQLKIGSFVNGGAVVPPIVKPKKPRLEINSRV